MISTRRSTQGLLNTLRFNKVSWTTGNPYNVRWQYKWRPAYYTYLKDGFEPTKVNKPEDSPAVRPPFYNIVQDALYRVFPSLKTIYHRSGRFQDPFQIAVLPSISLFFYQFWDLALGFKGLTILPWMLFWTRVRDRTLDPEINEVHLRDIIHHNAELGALFKPETIHLLDYDLEYDTGLPCEKKFPEFKNGFFRFFNNDTHMTTGFFKFGDLESGATMTLHVRSAPRRSRPCPSTASSATRSASPSTSTTSAQTSPTTDSSRKSSSSTRRPSSRRRDPSSSSSELVIATNTSTCAINPPSIPPAASTNSIQYHLHPPQLPLHYPCSYPFPIPLPTLEDGN